MAGVDVIKGLRTEMEYYNILCHNQNSMCLGLEQWYYEIVWDSYSIRGLSVCPGLLLGAALIV